MLCRKFCVQALYVERRTLKASKLTKMPNGGVATLEALPYDFSTLAIANFVRDTGAQTLKSLPKLPLAPRAPLRSSPQDDVEPFTIIEGPSAWIGEEITKDENQYIYHVSEKDIAELDAAIEKVENSGVRSADQMKGVTREKFPLPTFGPKLRELVEHGVHGRGFQMLRGIPVKKYNRWQLTLIWWGIGQHIGRVQPINRFGHLVNHIKCLENNTVGQRTRAPNTNQSQPMHSDQFATDIIGLFAIAKAKQGGESTFASSIAIHNELLRRGRKDLVEALTKRNFYLNKTGYENEKKGFYDPETGEPQFFDVAPYVYHDGRLSVAVQSTGYLSNLEEPEVPKLTPIQLEALRTVQALAIDPKLSIHFLLQPGDIQLLHNTTVMHGREAFQDGEALNERRHYLRWWVDSSGKSEEELRATDPLACFGRRLENGMMGGWPYAKKPYSIVLDTSAESDKSLVKYL